MLTDRYLLVASEDPATLSFLADNLIADGATVHPTSSCEEAIDALQGIHADAIIADLNGHTLQLIAAAHQNAPIVVLGAADRIDVVRKLERGADDVLIKPFSYPELRARVAALVRRAHVREAAPQTIGPLHIDRQARTVTLDGQAVDLGRKEYELLAALAIDPARVFTKEDLTRKVWHMSSGTTRTLDSHACRLRSKLAHPRVRFIVNVWGVGYRLLDVAP